MRPSCEDTEVLMMDGSCGQCEEFTRKQPDGISCAADECNEETEELIENGTCQLLPCDEDREITLKDGTCKLKPDSKPVDCE